MEVLLLESPKREHIQNITERIRHLILDKGWVDGAVLIFCPHTSAAVTCNEDKDPNVGRDLLVNLARTAPHHGDYLHPNNADAHVKASIIGQSLLLIVEKGQLQLGNWQGVHFCEFDGPRQRKLWIKWLG